MRRLGAVLFVLFFLFCCVISAGEYYGWKTPRWSEIESVLGLDTAPAAVPAAAAGQTEIHFIDVGQADATLIRAGDEWALIDAGDTDGADRLVDYLKSAGVTRLHCVVMTHPHADHIGGMPEILDAFPVDNFILPDFSLYEKKLTSGLLEQTLEKLRTQKANGCVVTTARRGLEITLGSGSLKVLLAGVKTDNINDLSVCLKFVDGGFSCLFTGDGEGPVEKELLAVEPDLRADIFQAGHHGSSTSNSARLLEAVRPAYVVISCGAGNSYGHPHAEALARFEKIGATILRTDTQGSIVLSPAEGGGIAVKTEKGSG